jgi:glyoxylase-like metal-dependent hydrolase (beta-lactamase superfamily II)
MSMRHESFGLTVVTGTLASAVVAFGSTSVLGQAPPARPDFSGVEIHISKLADGFYRLGGQGSPPGASGLGGAIGVLVGPDGVLLVDSQFAALTDKVIAAVRQISDGRIRFLVNTHVHGDHTGGNEHLGRMGVTIFARDELRRRLADPVPGGVPPGSAALPLVTYSGPTTIHMNGEDVRLLPIPAAHTDGDTLVVFPKADVIMTGDLFRTLGYPIIDRPNGGTLPGLLAGLGEIVRLSGVATKIVPGHGEVAGRDAVLAYRDMIVAVRDQVAPMVQRGMTVEQVLAAAPTAAYNSRVRGWDGPVPGGGTTADRFVSQLYAELKRQ